jgi:hypothetical protein
MAFMMVRVSGTSYCFPMMNTGIALAPSGKIARSPLAIRGVVFFVSFA